LGITIKETLNGFPANVKIMATDISTRVLKIAADGVYPIEKQKIFLLLSCGNILAGPGKMGRIRQNKKEISDMIDFSRFNLMGTPPSNQEFDIIFCRNVMIYFDKPTQASVVNKFYNCLDNGGYLFIGHSESLTGLEHAFKYIEPSVYRK
jgi:chemotaxis protein methyltransferase CheR